MGSPRNLVTRQGNMKALDEGKCKRKASLPLEDLLCYNESITKSDLTSVIARHSGGVGWNGRWLEPRRCEQRACSRGRALRCIQQVRERSDSKARD